MKRLVLLTVFSLVLIISLSVPACAQILPDNLEKEILSASEAKRADTREMIEQKYPSLTRDLFVFLCDSYPDFPTRYLKSRIDQVRKMDSKELAALYLGVSDEMQKSYGGKRSEFRKNCIQLLKEKDPGLPSDIKAFREKNSCIYRLNTLLLEKYPQFRKDVLLLMQEKHPALVMTIARDALNTTIKKDPRLFLDLRLEMLSIMESQFPELIKEVSEAPRKPQEMMHLVRENPKLALALSESIDSKYHGRIVELKQAVISGIIENHSKEICAAADDILSLAEKKYPGLAKDVVLVGMESASSFRREIVASHSGFFKEFQELREKNFPYLLRDLTAAIDRLKPGFRVGLQESVKKEFPEIEKKSRAFVESKYPGALKEIKDSLK